MKNVTESNVVVVGGGGRMGLPFSLSLANAGSDCKVYAYDTNSEVIGMLARGNSPYREAGIDPLLSKSLGKTFFPTFDRNCIANATVVVVLIGTAQDDTVPNGDTVFEFLVQSQDLFHDGQMIVVMSTVALGTTERLRQFFQQAKKKVQVAYCPERAAEGSVLNEIKSLPQIVSAFDPETLRRVRSFFLALSPEVVELTPPEAEFTKLMTNAWRYIEFAIANQFYKLSFDLGVDFSRVYQAMQYKYPRARNFARPGLTAGPCLVKDTKQLLEACPSSFTFGSGAIDVNEGLPAHLVERIRQEFSLPGLTVGILGMTFKAECDDTRGSLSYKLKNLLLQEGCEVLCTDEYVRDSLWLPLDDVLDRANVLVIAAPHRRYHNLPDHVPVIDVWDVKKW